MRKFLQEFSWEFILVEKLNSLPVYPSKIIRNHGWKLYSYTDFAQAVNKDVETIVNQYEKEGFVFWSAKKNTYIVCYNETYPPCVIRWTLAHEIGHIVLGHVSPARPSMSRIRADQRTIFESEAQGFARRILCPSMILHDCQAFEPEEIQELCGISKQAAQYRSDYIQHLETLGRYRMHPLECAVERQFEDFIRKYRASKGKTAFFV